MTWPHVLCAACPINQDLHLPKKLDNYYHVMSNYYHQGKNSDHFHLVVTTQKTIKIDVITYGFHLVVLHPMSDLLFSSISPCIVFYIDHYSDRCTVLFKMHCEQF